MIKKLSIVLAIIALLLTSCSAATQGQQRLPEVPAPSVVTSVQQVEGPNMTPLEASKGAYAIDQTAASADRMVVKNASLTLAVNDPATSLDTISKLAETMGGYVVSANVYQTTLQNGAKVPQGSITIRVPVERLDEALATIKKETTQPVISENITSQDVTAEYTDLNSRLTNLEKAEKQLQEIMTSAVRTEDVLSVYSQLVSVREQIEIIKGQMKYYEQSAALSSIAVELYANAAVQPLTIGGWQPVGVAKEALQSLINTLRSLANFGIRLVILYIPTLLVIFVPIALIIWGIVALVRRARRSKKAPTPTSAAES